MNQQIFPKITLVGAGPGDPELITRKGWKALQSANVVLYDALISPELLDELPASTLKVYVGKRAERHSFRQEDINLLLVQYALQYGQVVRLKGGDPFIFGRGFEELSYAQSFDIPVEVIPGISSSTALTALQGVPLTSRGFSHGFWVVTATIRSGAFSKDLTLAAQSNSTVVILMGMRKLPQIMELFKDNGKQLTPAMVIQNGSQANEKTVVGTVNDLANRCLESGVGAPGIIVVGSVVGLHRESEAALLPVAFRYSNTNQNAGERS